MKRGLLDYNNPKGNDETERATRTMKEELFWLKEWKGVKQVEDALRDWVKSDNATYLHSSLGYKTPDWVEANVKQEVA